MIVSLMLLKSGYFDTNERHIDTYLSLFLIVSRVLFSAILEVGKGLVHPLESADTFSTKEHVFPTEEGQPSLPMYAERERCHVPEDR